MAMLLGGASTLGTNQILANEMLRGLGTRINYRIVVFASFYVGLAVILGITTRALNVIIFSNRLYREKFGYLIRPKATWTIIVGLLGPHFLAAVYINFKVPIQTIDDHYCQLLTPARYFCSMLVSSTFAAAFLIKKLFEAKDRLGMGLETIRMYIVFYALPVPYMLLLIVGDIRIIEKRDDYQWLLYILNVYIMTETFVFSRSRWIHKLKPVGPRSVIPVNSATYATCLDFIPVPVMSVAFGAFVEKSLCIESWKFILDAKVYSETNFTTEEDQYTEFVVLLNTYIYQRSAYEINIDTKMRTGLEVFAKADAFMALDDRQRSHIFHDAAREIVKMLDQNIFTSFLKTPMFTEANQKVLDELVGDEGVTTERLVAESFQKAPVTTTTTWKHTSNLSSVSHATSTRMRDGPSVGMRDAPSVKTTVRLPSPSSPKTPCRSSLLEVQQPLAPAQLSRTGSNLPNRDSKRHILGFSQEGPPAGLRSTSVPPEVYTKPLPLELPPKSEPPPMMARHSTVVATPHTRGSVVYRANKTHSLGLDSLEQGTWPTTNLAYKRTSIVQPVEQQFM